MGLPVVMCTSSTDFELFQIQTIKLKMAILNKYKQEYIITSFEICLCSADADIF